MSAPVFRLFGGIRRTASTARHPRERSPPDRRPNRPRPAPERGRAGPVRRPRRTGSCPPDSQEGGQIHEAIPSHVASRPNVVPTAGTPGRPVINPGSAGGFGGPGRAPRYFWPEAPARNLASFSCFFANPWNPFSLGSTFDSSTSSWVTRTSPPFVETRTKGPLARS